MSTTPIAEAIPTAKKPARRAAAPKATKPTDAAPIVSKAAGPMTREQKQALGALVHAAARSVLAELPAGVDAAEAGAQLDKWLSYIPAPKAEA